MAGATPCLPSDHPAGLDRGTTCGRHPHVGSQWDGLLEGDISSESVLYIYIYICICVIILYSIYTCRLCKFAYIIVYNIVYAVNDVLRFLLLAARVGPSRFRMPNFWDWSDSRFVSTETLFASHLLRFRDIELHVSARTVRGDFHNRTLALQTFRSFPVFA